MPSKKRKHGTPAAATGAYQGLPAASAAVHNGGAAMQDGAAHAAQAAANGSGDGGPPACTQLPVVWEKVLWRRQPYPDNYTHMPTFLQDLVVNAHVPERRYWAVVLDSAALTQQLCSVVLAAAVPAHLHAGLLSATTLLLACVVLMLFGYAVCAVLGRHLLGGSVARGVRQCFLLVGGVFCLCPLLHTLTGTVSTDSVVALTVLLMLLHVALHDYNFVNSVTRRLTGAVSLGTAVFAAVLLASLLPSDLDVFAHVVFSLEVFLLSPFMRRYIRSASLKAHVAVTVCMVGAAAALLAPLSRGLLAVFLVSVVSVTFVCPRWLVSIQKFKAKINGPWDEAVPHIDFNALSSGSAPEVS